jgi:polyhydroxyalkanoate synthesis regulator phasin
MYDFTPDQTVYLPDGREAVYVTEYNGTHLVRVVYEVPGSYDEPPYSYPSDTVTGVAEVFTEPPVERYDQGILEKQKALDALRQQTAALHAEMREIERNKIAMEKAAAKYPCIQQALDFIEGRITHVVKWSGYGAATVHAMPEAFQQIDTWGGRKTYEGMRLLSLFGTDERGRSVGWGLHMYRDGSGGSTTQIWPARSETEARAKVQELMDAAIAAFRSGDEKWYLGHISIDATLKANPWLDTPEDWAAHIAKSEAKARQQKIDKLRAELTALEAGVQPSQKKRGEV